MLTITQLQRGIHPILATYNGSSSKTIDISISSKTIYGSSPSGIESLSPMAIKHIRWVELMAPQTLPSEIKEGDRVHLNLLFHSGSWIASDIVIDPQQPSLSTILSVYDQITITFMYLGMNENNSRDSRDSVHIESYQEGGTKEWFEPGLEPNARDRYLYSIISSGVKLDLDLGLTLSVKQRYTGILTDCDGELSISGIKTIDNRAVTSKGIESETETLSKDQNDLLASVLGYKRIADLAGVDVSVVAIAANTKALKAFERNGKTVFPNPSAA